MTPLPEHVSPLVPGKIAVLGIAPLAGDGSARTFFRVRTEEGTFVLCVGPNAAENAAYVRLATHLTERGVRVPAVHGFDPERGFILLEDLGDRNLFRAVAETSSGDELLSLYAPVLDLLVRMQVEGSRGFHLSLGFAAAPYGPELMVEQEGLYFAEEFAAGLLGLAVPGGFRSDLERLAAAAGKAPAHHFLHRDFQSRNIHLTPEGPCVIDFQGARPGPLAYDAAALLLDPYVAHAPELRSDLLSGYLRRLREHGLSGEVQGAWMAVGAFRLLQALGAFAKLGGRLRKTGFLEHAGSALATLLAHLGEEGRRSYPVLYGVVREAGEAWERKRFVTSCLRPPGHVSR